MCASWDNGRLARCRNVDQPSFHFQTPQRARRPLSQWDGPATGETPVVPDFCCKRIDSVCRRLYMLIAIKKCQEEDLNVIRRT